MDVVAVHPIVIDAKGVLQIFYGVMPPAWNKDALTSLLCHSKMAGAFILVRCKHVILCASLANAS